MTEIPMIRLEQLAERAGENLPMAKLDPRFYRMNIKVFAADLLEDLEQVGNNIEHIMLDRIIEIAVKHCGHKEVDATSTVEDMLRISSQEVFWTRYAYRIAAEVNAVQ